MAEVDSWFICRAGFVETARAIGLVAGARAVKAFTEEWPCFGIVDVDQQLVEHAADLALAHELRSLDSLHLAAALVLPHEDLVLATWDRRLHRAGAANGLELLPGRLD